MRHQFALRLARPLAAAALIAGGFVAGVAEAEPRAQVVVELFTSQGCVSCPPADAMIKELAARDDVLALSLHVDYWDYIGWPDRFARPEYTARQKAYAMMVGESRVGTPQMVVGGTGRVVGFKPMEVAEYLAAERAEGPHVEMSAELSATGALTVSAHAPEGSPFAGPVLVELVHFAPEETVTIDHGENAGATITYANVVTGWDHIGEWDGRGAFELTTEVEGEGAAAVILQEPGPGRVLAALRLR